MSIQLLLSESLDERSSFSFSCKGKRGVQKLPNRASATTPPPYRLTGENPILLPMRAMWKLPIRVGQAKKPCPRITNGRTRSREPTTEPHQTTLQEAHQGTSSMAQKALSCLGLKQGK
jgi:hypothetical protein